MKGQEDRELSSWKEIAAYLDVTERTAQSWEKTRGLPVRRLPGVRSPVYARVDELETWSRGREHVGRWPARTSGSTWGRPSVWTALATVFVVLLAAVVWSLIPPAAPPARWRVENDTLIVSDGNDVELWRHEFGAAGLDEAIYENPVVHPWFIDIDGDGSDELLFPQRSLDSGRSTPLICFASDGEELWRFVPGGSVAKPGQDFQDVYIVANVAPVQLGEDRHAILVVSGHFVDEPTQLALLSPDGEKLAEYWHSGQIGIYPPQLHVVDVDGDGVDEIYAAGINNARDRATIVLLDPLAMNGASKETDDYQLRGFETGVEVARVLFPRSSLNQLEDPYNVAVSIRPGEGTLTFGVVERMADPGNPSIQYETDLDFGLLRVSLSDIYRGKHESMRRDGELNRTAEEERAFLEAEGLEVLRPHTASGIGATGSR